MVDLVLILDCNIILNQFYLYMYPLHLALTRNVNVVSKG